jgi:hypothetical protein
MIMDIVELEFADERDLLRGVKREAIFWKGGVYTTRIVTRSPSRPPDGLRESVRILRLGVFFGVSKPLNFSRRSFSLYIGACSIKL